MLLVAFTLKAPVLPGLFTLRGVHRAGEICQNFHVLLRLLSSAAGTVVC